MIYGFLTDANIELGNYADAEKSAQWMLNLRGANVPSLTRAAYLRELFGDNEGAVELMEMALRSVSPTEVEDRAWITTQIAHLKLASGKPQQAEELLQQALSEFPNYHYALGKLAKIRIQQKRYDEAVQLYRRRYEAAPHAENLYDLAEALELAGKRSEAAQAFAEFEQKSLAETGKADNSNHELVFYYADHAKATAESSGGSATRVRPPAGCVHTRLLCLGIVSEREIFRRADADSASAGGWHSGCEAASPCGKDLSQAWRHSVGRKISF